MINSISRPHPEDALNPLTTVWGANPLLPDALPEYPRPQFVRNSHISLNGVWNYAITDTASGPVRPDGKILVPFSPESRLSGVNRQLKSEQYLWYFKTIPDLTRPSKDARLLLHFGAVDHRAEVYVNGRYQCTHVGGYLPFTVDITDALNAFRENRSRKNRLLVRVQDATEESPQNRGKQALKRGGMYYTAQSGIWQSVWLEWVPKGYLRSLRIIPHDDLTTVTLKFETSVPGSIEVAMFDERRQPFVRAFCSTSKEPQEEYPLDLCLSGSDLKPCNKIGEGRYLAQMRLYLEQPRVWTPEDPYLYHLSVSIGDDTLYTYFALRTCSVEEDENGVKRFCLNHKPLFLNAVLDQGYWPESLMTPPSDKALIYDITQMKSLGFNMIRKHVKIECARWYYHCDRLGMLVCQDMVSGGDTPSKLLTSYLPTLFPNTFTRLKDGARRYRKYGRADKDARAQFTNELKGMVSYLRNAPCIVIWSIFNEGWGQFDANLMVNIVKDMDDTRLIDHASGWQDQGGGDFLSIHNYFRKPSVEKDRHGRAVFLSEYGGYALRVEGHSSVERQLGYRVFRTPEELNEAWQALMTENIRPLIEEGLSGAVYTQLSDIEEEVNGLMTYDRKIIKVHPPAGEGD
ncbi:MAG: glycoside hydrolase family 2 [Lachnospiraceae bacterium]|nr:glycoside hydrolase family 2 [Lachnospiraceae bacterium]